MNDPAWLGVDRGKQVRELMRTSWRAGLVTGAAITSIIYTIILIWMF